MKGPCQFCNLEGKPGRGETCIITERKTVAIMLKKRNYLSLFIITKEVLKETRSWEVTASNPSFKCCLNFATNESTSLFLETSCENELKHLDYISWAIHCEKGMTDKSNTLTAVDAKGYSLFVRVLKLFPHSSRTWKNIIIQYSVYNQKHSI